VGRVRQVAASSAGGAGDILRLGTSQGLGERLDRILEALYKTAPSLEVQLVSAPAAERIARVRDGALDAAFVRGVRTAPGVELLPAWQDPLTAALPRCTLSPPSPSSGWQSSAGSRCASRPGRTTRRFTT
jgi:DNA-binding transcriptional LysR family regulator